MTQSKPARQTKCRRPPRRGGCTDASGFTLIEVLIALIVFAAIALISYRTLSSIFETRERLAEQSSRLRDQALFFTRLEADLGAIIVREIRDADGLMQPALRIVPAAQSSLEPLVSFSRSGFAAASGTSAAPQRIGYRLHNGNVELLIWEGLDQAPRAQAASYVALKDVKSFRWRVLDHNGVWQAEWRGAAAGANVGTAANGNPIKARPLPAAVELSLSLGTGTDTPIVRLFALREVGGG
jgi:general secretion pathway protein J